MAISQVKIEPTKADVPQVASAPTPGAVGALSGAPEATAAEARNVFPGFVENIGQFDVQARFRAQSGATTVWATQKSLVFDALRRTPTSRPPNASTAARGAASIERLVLTQEFVRPNDSVVIEPKLLAHGEYNFFRGTSSNNGQSGARRYMEIVYRELWPRIDLRVFPNGGDLEQEYVVQPHGDPTTIQVAYKGIKRLEITEDGSLLIHTAFGNLRESPPKVYQEIGGQRRAVKARFRLTGPRSYTFDIGSYSANHTLIVDPTLLYSTLIGGSGGAGVLVEEVKIAVDDAKNVYITGTTVSLDFPTTPGSFQPTRLDPNLYFAGYVTKLDPSGGRLIYSTFLEQSDTRGIAVNSRGEAYVVGWRYRRHPTTANGFAQSGAHFLTVLSDAGDRLLYSTAFGSDLYPRHYSPRTGVAVDAVGRAYITGTAICDLPTTANAVQARCAGGGLNAFVSVFDPSKSGSASLVYSTYISGTSIHSSGFAIALDAAANVYVTGEALPGFLTTSGSYQSASPAATCRYYLSNIPCFETFVAKLNTALRGPAALVYGTYIGGSGDSAGLAIAVDASESAYIVGRTGGAFEHGGTTAFPTTASAYNVCPSPSTRGSFATMVKLAPAGNSLVYSTCINHSDTSATSLALNAMGEAHIAGYTSSATFPVTVDAFQSTKGIGRGSDGFIAKLNATGSALQYSSYLGGSNNDLSFAIALDNLGDAYVAGHTDSNNFPVTTGAFKRVLTGARTEAFVSKFPLGSTLRILKLSTSVGGNAGSVTFSVAGSGFVTGTMVKLTGVGTDIRGVSVTIVTGTLLRVTVPLTGVTPGVRTVILTNPDGSSATLPASFRVDAGGAPDVRISKTGTTPVPGRVLTYFITVENIGNVDADDKTVLEILDDVQFELVGITPPGVAPLPIFRSTGTIVWEIPKIAPGTSVVLQYDARLKPTVALGSEVLGPACVDVVADYYDCQFSPVRIGVQCIKFKDVGQCILSRPLCDLAKKKPSKTTILACALAALECYSSLNDAVRTQDCADALIASKYYCRQLFVDGALCYRDISNAVGPRDPNEKLTSHSRYVRGDQTLTFPIHYENIGTAEARDIFITDILDPNLDDSTLQLLSPGATYNVATRTVKWSLLNVDLPPKSTGNVLLSIKPKPNLPSGTVLRNRATIQFEIFESLTTNETENIIDTTQPACKMDFLPAQTTSPFTLSWTATDAVGEVNAKSVFVSVNNGAFTPLLQNVRQTSTSYTGQVGTRYSFYCTATDTVGNAEIQVPTAEASTTVTSGSIPGDVNEDRVVNCRDIAVVRTSLGKRTGQPGWDARADVSIDGVVDVRDLAYVSQRLAVGTRCQ